MGARAAISALADVLDARRYRVYIACVADDGFTLYAWIIAFFNRRCATEG